MHRLTHGFTRRERHHLLSFAGMFAYPKMLFWGRIVTQVISIAQIGRVVGAPTFYPVHR